ncbi:MAG: N-acetyl-gamma-glutamyl-phosphate reductase [Bacteroidia bacterium]
MRIKAGIVGAAGYTGGELMRILLNHPLVNLIMAHSISKSGMQVSQIHRDLVGDTDLKFTTEFNPDLDVLFLCGGHGKARAFMQQHVLPDTLKVIDLSQDFRLTPQNIWNQRTFVYGLPERNKQAIREASGIANPGCFATAIQLGLLPLAQSGLLQTVHATGITGSSGAGQALSESTHFSWRCNNIQAYKSLNHQHMDEVKASLGTYKREAPVIHFIPWRGDFSRGIHVSAVMQCALDLKEVQHLFKAFYAEEPFTHFSETAIDLKQVVNTNKCLIHVEQHEGMLVVHSVLDNLLKGASGQAVQNMNLMFSIPENTGLQFKSTAF